ncbi:MAG: SET domain-containing protein-lysine N-methyltransferase [Sphingobacteriales bacterium]|nr:SET domain-containing protein-lysine N-methyltransferase [Sphingobacteriales bacterium]
MNHFLYIKNVKGKGRGVFSRQLIRKDELIESCPLIVLPGEDHDAAISSRLADYFFNFNKEEGTLALVLGFGSLYNHAVNPNAVYELDREARTMTYHALEDIPAGTEICINYSGEPGKEYKEWFEIRNIDFRGR